MYRLIVSDLDGTLLQDDSTLSEYTKAIIHKVSEHGIDFMLATGRIFGGARIFAKELNLNTPILSCNGALIKEAKGKLLYGKPIEPNSLTKVFQMLIERKLYFHFYGEQTFYTQKFSEHLSGFYAFNQKLSEKDRFPMVEVDPTEIVGKDIIYKVLVQCGENKDSRKELYEQLIQIPGISVTSSWFDTFDICADQVSKGLAIERYAKERGINQSEIICFGDNYNDMEMLRYAGLGVAVENGVEELKKNADYITGSNNEDGVAKAIEKFVF